MIRIKLTKTQLKKIQPEICNMINAYEDGKPGMLLAQIAEDGKTKVRFYKHSIAVRIQKITQTCQ